MAKLNLNKTNYIIVDENPEIGYVPLSSFFYYKEAAVKEFDGLVEFSKVNQPQRHLKLLEVVVKEVN